MNSHSHIGAIALLAISLFAASPRSQQFAQATEGVEFLENRGQWHAEALWCAHTPGLDFWVTRQGFVIDAHHYTPTQEARSRVEPGTPQPDAQPARSGRSNLVRTGQVLSIELEGATLQHEARGSRPGEGSHHFLTRDVTRHVRGVQPWRQVDFPDVLPAIDMRLLSDAGHPRYDFLVAPGGDVRSIVLRVRGADSLALRADGAVTMETAAGSIVMSAPQASQRIWGETRPVACGYRCLPGGRLGFSVGPHDRRFPLVIDPTVYSTVLGGSGEDELYQVALASNGDTIVVGNTISSDFPITPGAYSSSASGVNDDYLLARFDSSGSRIFSTRIGGSSEDYVWDVELDATGNIWISGYTNSPDFPTAGAQISNSLTSQGPGYGDAMICAVDGSGSSLLYGTFLGGLGGDVAREIGFDQSGDLIIAGGTASNALPVTATAVQPSRAGSNDGFLARLDVANGLQYMTFLGGSGYERLLSMAVAAPATYVCVGYTESTDFPTTPGTFDQSHNSPSAASPGDRDGFVYRLDEAAGTFTATYFGGGYLDEVRDCVIDPTSGNIIVAGISGGTTISPLPTTAGSFQPNYGGSYDGFVASFTPSLGTLTWSTWVGGSGSDGLNGLARDSSGRLWATGYTRSTDFPNTTSSQHKGQADTSLVVLDSTGSSLHYATVRGGSGSEYGYGIAVDDQSRATICGLTDSSPHAPGPFVFPWSAFPATRRYGAPMSTPPGVWDGFVTRIQAGSSPGTPASSTTIGGTCAAPGSESVLYVSPPYLGQPFSFSVRGQPGGTAEVYFGAVGQFSVPPCTIFMAPGTVNILGGFVLDASGFGSSTIVLPPLTGLTGLTLRAQAVVLGPPGSSIGTGVSNAMEFTLGQ